MKAFILSGHYVTHLVTYFSSDRVACIVIPEFGWGWIGDNKTELSADFTMVGLYYLVRELRKSRRKVLALPPKFEFLRRRKQLFSGHDWTRQGTTDSSSIDLKRSGNVLLPQPLQKSLKWASSCISDGLMRTQEIA